MRTTHFMLIIYSLISLSTTIIAQKTETDRTDVPTTHRDVYLYEDALAIAKKEQKLLIIRSPFIPISKKDSITSFKIEIDYRYKDILDQHYVLAIRPLFLSGVEEPDNDHREKSDIPIQLQLKEINGATALRKEWVVEDSDGILHYIIPDFNYVYATELISSLEFVRSEQNYIDEQYAKVAQNLDPKEIYQLWRLFKNRAIHSGGVSQLFFWNFKNAELYRQAAEIYSYEGREIEPLFRLLFKEKFMHFDKQLGREKPIILPVKFQNMPPFLPSEKHII